MHSGDPVLAARLEPILVAPLELLEDVRLAGGRANGDQVRAVRDRLRGDLGNRRHALLRDAAAFAVLGDWALGVEGADAQGRIGGLGQLGAEVGRGPRHEVAIDAEGAHRESLPAGEGEPWEAEAQVERERAVVLGPWLRRPAVCREQIEPGLEDRSQSADVERPPRRGLDHLVLRLDIHEPCPVAPEPEVGQAAAGRLDHDASPLRDVEPPRELLEVLERLRERLQLDERRERLCVALGEGVNGERRFAGGIAVAVRDDAHLAAVEERVDAAVAHARLALDRPGAGHAVDELQRGALSGLDRDRVSAEGGDGELHALPAAGRDFGPLERGDRLGWRGGRALQPTTGRSRSAESTDEHAIATSLADLRGRADDCTFHPTRPRNQGTSIGCGSTGRHGGAPSDPRDGQPTTSRSTDSSCTGPVSLLPRPEVDDGIGEGLLLLGQGLDRLHDLTKR